MRDNEARSPRPGRLVVAAVVVLGIAALVAARRRGASEPEAESAPVPSRSETSVRDRQAMEVPRLPSIEEPPAPEAVVDVATEPAAAAEPTALEPLAEGATQAEMEAYMAKAQVVHAKPSPAGVAERDEHLIKLRESGPGSPQWVEHFRRVQNDWFDIDNQQRLGIEFGPWDCFKDGCTTTIRFDEIQQLERFTSSVYNGKTTREWRGAGFCSAPIRADTGELEATWIFYAPPA